MSEPGISMRLLRYSHRNLIPVDWKVAAETTVSLSVNGIHWLTSQCTPTLLNEMAVGFLYNEGVIQSINEIADVRLCQSGDHVDVWLNHPAQRPERWIRTSGCGGGHTSEFSPLSRPASETQYEPEFLLSCMDELFQAQTLYREARGVHCSALSDGLRLRLQAEDIGRHNSLDKLAGQYLLSKADFPPRLILTTGRISSEMLQKAVRIGAEIVLSRTSPTNASVNLAQQWGITLIGYARRDQFLVYSHPQRLAASADWQPPEDAYRDLPLSAD